MDNKILFAKIKDGAVIPTKRDEDAAYDIYACFNDLYLEIKPNQTINIPTGIISAFPAEYVAVLKERGSTGSKGIGQRCGVIDSGYRGEWFVTITNHNTRDVVIVKDAVHDIKEYEDGVGFTKLSERCIVYPYEKAIAQVLFLPLAQLNSQEATPDEIRAIASARGNGKLGSSNK